MNSFSEITHLADVIAANGMSAVPHDRVRTIATAAVQHGASPVLAQVVIDPAQPDVARQRAFGRITAAFLRAGRPLDRAA